MDRWKLKKLLSNERMDDRSCKWSNEIEDSLVVKAQ